MFWESIGLGLLFGWLRKGEIKNLNQLGINGWPLIFIALLMQGLVLADFNLKTAYLSSIYSLLYIGSFILLLAFIYLHRANKGLPIIGAGIFLNLLVIAANGGTMPVEGTSIPSDVFYALASGEKSPFYSLMNENTKLAFLGDRISLEYRPNQLLSVGDLVIATGVFFFVQNGMIGRHG